MFPIIMMTGATIFFADNWPEHLWQLRVLLAQQGPLHVGRDLPPTHGPSQRMSVHPEGKWMDWQFCSNLACSFSLRGCVGTKPAASGCPIYPSCLWLRNVSVLYNHPRIVTINRNFVHTSVVYLSENRGHFHQCFTCAAFTLVDPKSVKNTDELTIFFMLSGSAHAFLLVKC